MSKIVNKDRNYGEVGQKLLALFIRFYGDFYLLAIIIDKLRKLGNIRMSTNMEEATMIKVPSSEFSKNFGKYREGVHRGPVAVTWHERVTGYFVSADEYEEYVRLKKRMAKAFAVEELTEETIRAIAKTKMSGRHKHLNDLLD